VCVSPDSPTRWCRVQVQLDVGTVPSRSAAARPALRIDQQKPPEGQLQRAEQQGGSILRRTSVSAYGIWLWSKPPGPAKITARAQPARPRARTGQVGETAGSQNLRSTGACRTGSEHHSGTAYGDSTVGLLPSRSVPASPNACCTKIIGVDVGEEVTVTRRQQQCRKARAGTRARSGPSSSASAFLARSYDRPDAGTRPEHRDRPLRENGRPGLASDG